MTNQRTIGSNVSFQGPALQTGGLVHVVCRPGESDSGIVFKRTDLADVPALCLNDAMSFSSGEKRRSTIASGEVHVQTVEHFLAALWGLGIDNIICELDGPELPGLDGSAIEFFRLLKNSGIKELPKMRRVIKIMEDERIEEGDSFLAVRPSDAFSISYFIEYNVASIKCETFRIELDQDVFQKEIAPARTFCLKEEAAALLKAGLGKGASLENTLVMADEGPLGGVRLRFPNEPVRHKVLDIVGDFYMCGRPVIGEVIAKKTGHGLNMKMIKRLYEKYIKGKAEDGK